MVAKLNGGKLEGKHYYLADVTNPINSKVEPYVAECSDIIEALDMTFNEGECFKALWRLAASRQGRGKQGNTEVYDADKVAHYGMRVAVQTKQKEKEVTLDAVMQFWVGKPIEWELDAMDNNNEGR